MRGSDVIHPSPGTFMIGRELSNRTYPEIAVPDSHHMLSHDGGNPEKIEKLARINRYHVEFFAYYLQRMKEARDGRIVNVSSMTVPAGIPLFLHYVASKAAIVGLTRALARELGEWGVCVNAIAPDYVPHDEEYAAQQPELAAALARQRCFQRDMTAEDLVGTLRYLVDPGSAFVTGQTLYVNGGRLFSGV